MPPHEDSKDHFGSANNVGLGLNLGEAAFMHVSSDCCTAAQATLAGQT